MHTLTHVEIMEDRYEIRGKIGQGGLGAVYRAYDTRMNREVAIKRIGAGAEDVELQEESTRQLLKEAGALASLQHPHIVTVYDVGSDEDGPYVVMELIAGKTLDELVENAPLTWPDFRELALQTHEALIAAQELHLVHRDLKPGNVMLSWLPSGKFQVKIVDFGLAKLTPKPSLQTLDQSESVFGSIYFMAPEQFERGQLDVRVDIYAIGCVFYHALTGHYPFDGDNGPQVMAAHLQHTVAPIQEVQAGIPLWACDWIMWHMNRMPSDRPESARQALQVFLQNDAVSNPPTSTGNPAPVQQIRQPGPGLNAARVQPARLTGTQPQMPVGTTGLVKTKTSPQPLKPPDGYKPSVHTGKQSLHATPEPEPGPLAPVPLANRMIPVSISPSLVGKIKQRQKKSHAAKMAVIAGAGAVVVIFGGFLFVQSNAAKKEVAMLEQIVRDSAKIGVKEVPVTAQGLKLLLEASVNETRKAERPAIYKALRIAKATDATNASTTIAEFVLSRPTLPAGARAAMIKEVIRKRKDPAVIPYLKEFAETTSEMDAAREARDAATFMMLDP